MSKYKATVIKTGNSIALRVHKQYVVDAGLKLGDKVQISLATKQHSQDHQKIGRVLAKLQKLSAYADIKDPVAWQRQIRRDRPLPGR